MTELLTVLQKAKRENFPHREYFGKKFFIRFSCPSHNRIKEQWLNIKVEQIRKCACSIQDGDDCRAEIDSYPDSFVAQMTRTVLSDSGCIPHMMADSVLQVDCQHLHHNVHKCPQENHVSISPI